VKVLRRWQVGLPGIIISAAAIYLLLSQISIGQINFSQIPILWLYLLPCAGLLVMGVLMRALRWRVLLDEPLPLGQSFSIVSATYLANSLLPLRAGESVRIYMVTQTDPPIPVLRTASTIIVERILDTVIVAFLVSGALVFAPATAEAIRAVASIAAPLAVLALLALVIVARYQAAVERLMRHAGSRSGLSQRLINQATHFLAGLRTLARLKTFSMALGLTAAGWAMTISAGYMLLLAFFGAGSWITATLFVGAIAFAVAIPAVPGNLGTFELSVLLVLEAMHYPENNGALLAFGIMLHTIDLLVYFVCGIGGLFHLGISISQVTKILRDTQPQAEPE